MPTSPFESLELFPVIITLPVQWGDQDAFGHVNNTVYFRWFESGRIAYLDQCHLSATMDEQQLGPILATITCNYRAQLGFPDNVKIGTRVSRLGNSSIGVDHAVFSERLGRIVADGTSTIVSFDYRANKPVAITDEIRAAIEGVEGRKL